MIPMRVANENMDSDRRGGKLFLQLNSEVVDSGTGIKNKDVTVRSNFDT